MKYQEGHCRYSSIDHSPCSSGAKNPILARLLAWRRCQLTTHQELTLKIVQDEMSLLNYIVRILTALSSSTLFPSRFRVHLLRYLGYDISSKVFSLRHGARLGSRKLTIKEGVFVNDGLYFDGSDFLVLEENVHLGSDVRVITGTHLVADTPLFRCGEHKTAPVKIQRGSWVGSGVTILPGVTVATGCVIGAGSLLTKSTRPNGIYIGSPAKRLRDLPTVSLPDSAPEELLDGPAIVSGG